MYYFKDYVHGQLLKIIRRHRIQGNFLEIGCGEGGNLSFLARQGFSGVGVDFSEGALKTARKTLDAEGFQHIETRKQDLIDIQGTFDFILALDVIEHIEQEHIALTLIRKLLKNKNSHFIIGVPSGPYMADDLAFGHFRRYSRKSLKRALDESGFELKECLNLGYPFLYYARLLSNRFTELSANTLSSEQLIANTMNSDVKHPMAGTPFAKLLDGLLSFKPSRILLNGLMNAQNIFSNADKGHTLLAAAVPKL